jgi:DnaJ-class molecular chaperone
MRFLDGYKTYDPEKEGFGSSYEWKRQFHKRMSKEESDLILKEDDPYVILEINRNANKSIIRKAFYRLAMKWHPDHNPDKIEKSTEMMKKINAAYSKLINNY